MLSDVFEFLKNLERSIGFGASVRVGLKNNNLLIRVDWLDEDKHFQYQITDIEIHEIKDESILYNYLVNKAQEAYSKLGLGSADAPPE